ncbi:MAG: MASE3 domain-containing protein [Desulfurivibrionaceae bacterium]
MLDSAINPPFRRVGPLLLVLTGLFILVWKLPPLAMLQGTQVMTLWVHITAETFSIVVAGMIFAVTWNAYAAERPAPLIVLACGLLAVGLLDFGHMLSFKGMPDFVTPSGPEKGLNFWLTGRLLFALTMVAIVFLPWTPLRRPPHRYWLLAGNLSVVVFVFWLILYHPQVWPRTFIEGQGLTPFKIGVEHGIIGLLFLPAVLFLVQAWRDHKALQADYLSGAAVVTILSELTFTLYTDVSDIFNLLGHVYKIVAFALIYRAVFVVSIREPFLRLHQASAETNQLREQYTSLAELSPVGIFRTDAVGRCLYVNDRWSEIAGLSPAEALGDGWTKTLHPEDRERVDRKWEQADREQQKFSDEYRFQKPDGTVTWVLGQAKAELNSKGQLVGHVGTITDITERKQAEVRMAQSEERLRSILDSLDAMVYVADMETYELLFINKYGRDIFGDCAGKKCWQILQAGQSGPCAFCTNGRLLSADGAPTGVYAWEFQNTVTQQWFDCRDQAIRWHDNKLVRMEIATDISLRKQAEDEIRKAKEEWERTFAAIGDIATIMDANHHILRANRKACEVTGLSAEELAGKLCYEVFHGGTQPCDGCPSVLTARDATTHTAEIVHERLGRTFSVSASPVCGPNNELLSIIYISRDITELKTLEQQLRQAQKMEAIGTLAGGIAHDFNNILTPVLGYSEIISESLPAGSSLADLAREILKAGRRARDLVKQILTFSRQTEQERTPLKLQLVIKEALKLLRSSLPSSIEIKQEITTEAMVLADPTMIHQVLMNLCTNAYHAMRETGGILAVSLTEVEINVDDYVTELHLKPGAYLRLEVSDTGCGMPHHLLERIFEPYFTTKDNGEGTGLGLSVVHGIVTSLGGHVTVYSEPGKGSTFHVYIPKCLEKKEGVAAAPAVTPLPTGNEHILVVDDEKVIAELMQKTLEILGYRVSICIDSRQALEQFAAHPSDFDLVITDMTMPHLTGAELAQQLLAIKPELPIVLCTGFSEIINEEKAWALGIRRLLMKPVLRDELARVLRQMLDQPKE